MISAIVLASDAPRDDDPDFVREIVVRSLVWLVSAVVAGVVRDVTLATPPSLDLGSVADQSGCDLVQDETEAGRLTRAVGSSRAERLLIVKAGYAPDGRLTEELDAFVRRNSLEDVALIRATPQTVVQRLMPDRAPVVGMLVSKMAASKARSFRRLVTNHAKAITLTTRVAPIL